MNELFKFRAGDLVKCTFYGDEIFTVEGNGWNMYPFRINVPSRGVNIDFTSKGLSYTGHTHSIITLHERPKKMVKKVLKGWVNVYPNTCENEIHLTRDRADVFQSNDRIACVEINQEYEVEE